MIRIMSTEYYLGVKLPEAGFSVAAEKKVQRLIQLKRLPVGLGKEGLVGEDRREGLQFDQPRFKLTAGRPDKAEVGGHEMRMGSLIRHPVGFGNRTSGRLQIGVVGN